MGSKQYTLEMNCDEEGILNQIHNFIYHMHQGTQTGNEYKVTITVEKYE